MRGTAHDKLWTPRLCAATRNFGSANALVKMWAHADAPVVIGAHTLGIMHVAADGLSGNKAELQTPGNDSRMLHQSHTLREAQTLGMHLS